MPTACKPTRRLFAVGLVTLLLASYLAGCLAFEDDPLRVKTTCQDRTTPPDGQTAERPPTTAATAGGQVAPRSLTGGPIRILTFLGSEDGLRAAADLAARELQDVGVQVNVEHVPSAMDEKSTASALHERLHDRSATAVLGSVDNESTWGLLEEAVKHNIPVITSRATEPSLTEARPNDGGFFRVPPSDTYRGRALGELVWTSGCSTAVMLVERGEETGSLAAGFRDAFENKGGIVREVIAVDGQDKPEDVVKRIQRNDPHAMVLALPPARSAEILRAAYEDEDRLSAKTATFLGPGLETAAFTDRAGQGRDGSNLAAGLRGAALQRPAEEFPESFRNAYRFATGEAPGPYAAETYDAVYAIVLAAECAGSAQGRDVKERILDVWNERAGDAYVSGEDPATAVTTARSCRVDYVGASSLANEDWDARGEPATAVYREWIVLEDGTPRTTRSNLLVSS